MIIAYGYLSVVFYQIMVTKTHYEFSFLLSHILFHFVPLFLFQRYFDVKGNLLFTLLFLMLYFGYITQQKMTLYDIYLTERHMKSFEDFKENIIFKFDYIFILNKSNIHGNKRISKLYNI